MNKAYLTVGIILMSIIALAAINLIQNYSTGNELDYYLLKETADAAMADAVDPAFAREAVTRIDKEKFEESFLLRFASTVDNRRYYNIKFYDINEVPPKVSIKVVSGTTKSFKGEAISIVSQLTSIVETNNKTDPAAVQYLNTRNQYTKD